MNKIRRTATLDLFFIKKLRNTSIASSLDPNPNIDAHMGTTDINLNQHAISSNVNEMTTSFVSLEKNRDGLMNSTFLKRGRLVLVLC